MLRELEDEATAAPINGGFDSQNLCDNILLTINQVIEKVNKNICLECGKQFNRYMSYKQHWGTQLLIKPKFRKIIRFLCTGVHETSLRKFECDKCGMVFAWKSTLVKHQTHFHSDAPIEMVACDQPGCDKIYKSITQLKVKCKQIVGGSGCFIFGFTGSHKARPPKDKTFLVRRMHETVLQGSRFGRP